MAKIIGLIGTGEMGSGIGGLLAANGARVITTLQGRSAGSAERIANAGVEAVADLAAVAEQSEITLSIVPPEIALSVAQAFAAAYVPRTPAPVYVDCNAVAPETVKKIAAVITAAGIRFVDAGILGNAPYPGYDGPKIYASGADVAAFQALTEYKLLVMPLDGGIGAASAMKMCFAGISKGFTAIGTSMYAAAKHAGVEDAFAAEMSAARPELNPWLLKQIPTMYPKAYRWVAEMREIGTFGANEPGVQSMYEGFAQLYEAVAAERARQGKR